MHQHSTSCVLYAVATVLPSPLEKDLGLNTNYFTFLDSLRALFCRAIQLRSATALCGASKFASTIFYSHAFSILQNHVLSIHTCNNVFIIVHNSTQADIVRAVGGTNRGKTATPAQRAAILQHLTALEACNTVQDPTASPMLSGTWALLYQAPLTEAAAKDKASTLEGAQPWNWYHYQA